MTYARILKALFALAVLAAVACSPLEAQASSRWRTGSWADEMTDRVAYFASLRPAETSGVPNYAKNDVEFTVLCSDGMTLITVSWGTYVGGDEREVTHRVGTAPAVARNWHVTRNNTVLLGEASLLLRQILASEDKRFLVRTTPILEGARTLLFDMSEIAEALTDIRRMCRW